MSGLRQRALGLVLALLCLLACAGSTSGDGAKPFNCDRLCDYPAACSTDSERAHCRASCGAWESSGCPQFETLKMCFINAPALRCAGSTAELVSCQAEYDQARLYCPAPGVDAGADGSTSSCNAGAVFGCTCPDGSSGSRACVDGGLGPCGPC